MPFKLIEGRTEKIGVALMATTSCQDSGREGQGHHQNLAIARPDRSASHQELAVAL
jgi:hypothetical protein